MILDLGWLWLNKRGDLYQKQKKNCVDRHLKPKRILLNTSFLLMLILNFTCLNHGTMGSHWNLIDSIQARKIWCRMIDPAALRSMHVRSHFLKFCVNTNLSYLKRPTSVFPTCYYFPTKFIAKQLIMTPRQIGLRSFYLKLWYSHMAENHVKKNP